MCLHRLVWYAIFFTLVLLCTEDSKVQKGLYTAGTRNAGFLSFFFPLFPFFFPSPFSFFFLFFRIQDASHKYEKFTEVGEFSVFVVEKYLWCDILDSNKYFLLSCEKS